MRWLAEFDGKAWQRKIIIMLKNKNQLAIFQGYKIRRHWDEKKEKWYFSVIDIIAALTVNSIKQTRLMLKRFFA